jgi:hypothetical protein
MSGKKTMMWVVVAAVLFGVIWLERHLRRPPAGPAPVLAQFDPATVTAVEVRPGGAGQVEIRAERTNGSWRLTAPLQYPAQALSVENLLSALAKLTPVWSLGPTEIRNRPGAEDEYGLAPSRATSIILQQGERSTHVLLGALTAPGDQLFLQVVGVDAVQVVDADLLKVVPRGANDWRDTSFLGLKVLAPDGVRVTNNAKTFSGTREAATTFALQRDPTNHLWSMVRPIEARGDTAKVEQSLERLQDLRILQFVSDDPKNDLESFGLQPPALEIALSQGTNLVALLQFGQSPTNDPTRVFARRLGQKGVVAVSKELLEPWRVASVDEFRDPRLFVLTERVDAIEVQAEDTCSLQRQTNDTWRIEPRHWPADAGLVRDLLATLGDCPISGYVKYITTAKDWPEYGLAPPARRFVLQTTSVSAAGAPTNVVLADLSFGLTTNYPGKVFARRADESSLYAISTNDFQRLPWNSCQLRDRKLWNFTVEDVIGITIRQQGGVRQLTHKGQYDWALAGGAQGTVDPIAIEETVRGLAQASAVGWVACGETNRARFGFTDKSYQLTFELKGGTKAAIEFGQPAPSGLPYAGTALDGEFWVFELPWLLFRDAARYLSIP